MEHLGRCWHSWILPVGKGKKTRLGLSLRGKERDLRRSPMATGSREVKMSLRCCWCWLWPSSAPQVNTLGFLGLKWWWLFPAPADAAPGACSWRQPLLATYNPHQEAGAGLQLPRHQLNSWDTKTRGAEGTESGGGNAFYIMHNYLTTTTVSEPGPPPCLHTKIGTPEEIQTLYCSSRDA